MRLIIVAVLLLFIAPAAVADCVCRSAWIDHAPHRDIPTKACQTTPLANWMTELTIPSETPS